MNDRKRGLGRGLSALMGEIQADAGKGEPRRPDIRVPVESIRPNPDQPRRTFPREQLDELARSIREKGVIQPLIVRENPSGSGTYEIVAGERRWRAAQIAQLHELPVVVRDLDDTEVLEFAIIENIQRADLNPVEEAQGYRQLMDRFGHTQERLADAMGKSRSHIANLLRLLNLPDEILGFVRDGRLSAGHARALVVLDDPAPLARRVVAEGLSVREIERLAKSNGKPPGRGQPRPAKDADTRALEQELSANLSMPVTIDQKPAQEGGTLSIRFRDFEQLDALCQVLSVTPLAGSR
jgi:ParB family transcriptional regulator, chromosome partitioning protein